MARRATVLRSRPSRWARASSRALTSGATRRLNTGLPSWRAWRWALCWSGAGGTGPYTTTQSMATPARPKAHSSPDRQRRHQIWGSYCASLSSSGLRAGPDQARRRRSRPGSNREQGPLQSLTGGDRVKPCFGSVRRGRPPGSLVRWVPFIGQFWPLTSLPPGGRNRV